LTRLLELRELTVRFGGTFRVGPVTFATDHGVVHVEGPNGGGKTTFLRAVCGELLPSSGEVLIGGENVHRQVLARRRVALVPSIPELPGILSVREAIQFTAGLRGARRWNGEGYCVDLRLDPELPLASASAGQRRKAELICALAGDPEVLLLDETFAHLDSDSCKVLAAWVCEWSTSRLIMLTHHGALPVPVDAALRIDQGTCTFVLPKSKGEGRTQRMNASDAAARSGS
jgi:ABC-2 type transport system ATP-binding protein